MDKLTDAHDYQVSLWLTGETWPICSLGLSAIILKLEKNSPAAQRWEEKKADSIRAQAQEGGKMNSLLCVY